MVTRFMDASFSSILDNQRDLNVKGIEQSPPDGDYTLNVPTATLLGYNPIMTFSEDSLNLSSSNKDLMVFADMADLNFVSKGEVRSAPVYTAYYTTINNYVITTGKDNIITGSGDDVIFGDAKDMNVHVKGGIALGSSTGGVLTGADTEGVFLFNSFTFQADTIDARDGHNTVYGDMRDINWNLVGGHNFVQTAHTEAVVGANTIITGNDTITGGNDGNTIFADIQNFIVTAYGGVNSAAASGFNGVVSSANIVTLGSDIINTGSGKDTIYGDGQDLIMSAYGGDATRGGFTALASVNSLTLTSGSDIINAGLGDDWSYGDFRDITFQSVGGHAVTDESTPLWTEATALLSRQFYQLGNDTINGDKGNDSVWGDAHQFSMIAQGGTVSGSGVDAHALGSIAVNRITMGNDTINGGEGNDRLFGDLEVVDITGNIGKGTGDVEFDFTRDISVRNQTLTALESKFTFGNDNINAGDGNDLIVGDALTVQGLDMFLNDLNPLDLVFNKVVWGNDILTGGSHADTFAFVMLDTNQNGLLEMQGNDTITDFSVSQGDKMMFKGVMDLNALNTAASFATNAGDGNDTVITFDNSTSITLLDVTFTSFTNSNSVIIL